MSRATFRAAALSRHLPAVGLVVAVAGFAVGYAPPGQERAVTAAVTAIVAAVTVLTLAGYRLLVPRVGTATAWAGLVVLWAVLVGGFFALSPDCFTTAQPHRCAPRELATWTVAGALLPVVALTTVYLPYRVVRLAGRLLRAGCRRLRSTLPADATKD